MLNAMLAGYISLQIGEDAVRVQYKHGSGWVAVSNARPSGFDMFIKVLL